MNVKKRVIDIMCPAGYEVTEEECEACSQCRPSPISKPEKYLLNVKEVCSFTGFGETKVRELLRKPGSTFTVRLGSKLFANKEMLIEYLDRCAKYQIVI